MKVKMTAFSIAANVACLAAILGTVLFIALRWSSLPAQIPAHYNALGEVDRWGSRGELLILPAVLLVLYAGITALEQFPQAWNTGVRVTEENAERVYRTLKNMICCEKLVLCLDFGFLSVNSALVRPLPAWFLPAFLLLIFVPLLGFIIRLVRIR